jgi:hypothetical protein
MARILNFSLTMKDGHKVKREIAELREHFDLETVLGLYKEGTLQRWLKRNGYAEMAAQLDDLDEDAPDFTRVFCRLLGVEDAHTADVDVEEISERTWRLRRLRDYTTDPYLLERAQNAAFSQADLDALIDEGADEIILCNGRFTIPLKVRGTKYYGAGKAVAVIESDEVVDFARKYITFRDVRFDERYEALVEGDGTELQQRTERAAEEARRREAEARRALEQRVADQAAHELRMKLKAEKAPAILAETLGVLMHGCLFGGVKIWNRSHTADVSGFSFRPCGKQGIKTFLEKRGGTMPDDSKFGKDERFLGSVVLSPQKKKDEGFSKGQWGSLAMMAAPLIPGIGWTVAAVGAAAFGIQSLFKDGDEKISMIFTDAAIRFNDTCIPYMVIEDAVEAVGEDGQKVVRLSINGENKPLDLPIGQYLDTSAVQLFLITAINFYGDHYKRSPNAEEMRQLAKVILASVNDDCILNYLA